LQMHQGATISGQLRPMDSASAASDRDKPSIRLAATSG
jgi:hypothetical protein